MFNYFVLCIVWSFYVIRWFSSLSVDVANTSLVNHVNMCFIIHYLTVRNSSLANVIILAYLSCSRTCYILAHMPPWASEFLHICPCNLGCKWPPWNEPFAMPKGTKQILQSHPSPFSAAVVYWLIMYFKIYSIPVGFLLG